MVPAAATVATATASPLPFFALICSLQPPRMGTSYGIGGGDSPPSQHLLGFEGMDGEPALHRQFFISSLYAAMGVYGEPAKAHGFHVFFSQHTCPLYEQSRRSGLLIINMAASMKSDISRQSASSRQRAWARNVCHANGRCDHRTGPIHGIGLQPLSWQCLKVDQIGQYETACQCSIACTYKPLSCHFHMPIYRKYK